MPGNGHVRFGPGAVGKGPAGRHLANGPPVRRALVGYRWAHREDTVRLEAALRAGLAARGVPKRIYVDYADLRVMPTSAGSRWSAGGRGVHRSA